MMYPEMMQIIVEQYQRDLRKLYNNDQLIPETNHRDHPWRRHLGDGMIRIGTWLGGCVPVLPEPMIAAEQT